VKLSEWSYWSEEKIYAYYWKIGQQDSYKRYYRCPKDAFYKFLSDMKNTGVDIMDQAPNEIPGEELLLDGNQEAKGRKYFDLGWIALSPDENLLSYGVDFTGDELYEIVVRQLNSENDAKVLDRYRIENPDEDEDDEDDDEDEEVEDEMEDEEDENDQDDPENCGIAPEFEWSEDNRTYYYVTVDETLRAYRVYKHCLDSKSHDDDQLLFEEKDDTFSVSISKCLSNEMIVIESSSSNTTEYFWMDARNPEQAPRVIIPRVEGVEYHIDHLKESSEFLIWTNEGGRKNFSLIKCPVSAPALTSSNGAQEILPYTKDIFIEDALSFRNFIALSVRRGGVMRCLIVNKADNSTHEVQFPDSARDFYFKDNNQYECDLLRLKYSSPVTTPTIFEYDVPNRTLLTRKVYQVPGFVGTNFHVQTKYVRSRDGQTDIPLTLIFKKRTDGAITENGQVTQPLPTLLTAYGAYCVSNDCNFRSNILPLLNRGVLFVIAHVRGGGECGREWYDDGKLLNKKNTFLDFVDTAEFLIQKGYTNRDLCCAYGASAGGLTMGTSLNLAPHLFKAMILDVPFVNVLETMTNPSIPLTTLEYKEWGNPHEKQFEEYIKSYSPIDNLHVLENAEYVPNLLVLSGLNDPRVSYLEPTAYCTRLRQLFSKRKNQSNLLVLKTNMEAGHSGASGRFDALKEWAFMWAFVIQQIL